MNNATSITDPPRGEQRRRRRRHCARQSLLIAATIALSLSALNGCSDGTSTSAGPTTSRQHNEKTGQAENTPPKTKLPVDSETSKQPAQPADPDLAQQIKTLRQRLATQDKRTHGDLTRQADRIHSLEQHVKTLRHQVAQLEQTQIAQGAGDPPADDPHSNDKAAADDPPKAAAADKTGGSNDRKPKAEPARQARADAPHDGQGDDPAKLSPAHCASRHAPQFDVAYSADSRQALAQARSTVQSAGFTDLFLSRHRLYLGRYDTCRQAAHRRANIFDKTAITASIAAVMPPSHTQHAASTKSGASQRSPFTIVSVEMRGHQRYLGVTSGNARSLADITWLYPGDRYHHWRLTRIERQAGRAIFTVGHRTVPVALPARL